MKPTSNLIARKVFEKKKKKSGGGEVILFSHVIDS